MGFKGVPRSEEVKKRISEKLKGIKRSDETKQRMSLAQKGNMNFLGKHHSEESKAKIGFSKIGKPRTEEVRRKISISCKGNNLGIKNVNFKHGMSNTRKYNILSCKRYAAMKRYVGEISIETIQMVYEDNIKKFGKLTCYLCLFPIEFGRDHLEHKTPASKGGTNLYENLEVACINCNVKKRDRTEQEYRESLK